MIANRKINSPNVFKTIVSLGERNTEVAAVAGPIFDKNRIIAALSVSGPIGRFTKDNVKSMTPVIEEKCRHLSSIMMLD